MVLVCPPQCPRSRAARWEDLRGCSQQPTANSQDAVLGNLFSSAEVNEVGMNLNAWQVQVVHWWAPGFAFDGREAQSRRSVVIALLAAPACMGETIRTVAILGIAGPLSRLLAGLVPGCLDFWSSGVESDVTGDKWHRLTAYGGRPRARGCHADWEGRALPPSEDEDEDEDRGQRTFQLSE
jgi:hypothetical protein